MRAVTVEWIEKAEGDFASGSVNYGRERIQTMMLPVFTHNRALKNT
jgi:hypothetical protein